MLILSMRNERSAGKDEIKSKLAWAELSFPNLHFLKMCQMKYCISSEVLNNQNFRES